MAYWWEKPEWLQTITYGAIGYDYAIYPEAYTYQGPAFATSFEYNGEPGLLPRVRAEMDKWLGDNPEVRPLTLWIAEFQEWDPGTGLYTGRSVYTALVSAHGSPFPPVWVIVVLVVALLWLVSTTISYVKHVQMEGYTDPFDWMLTRTKETAGNVLKAVEEPIGEFLRKVAEDVARALNALTSGVAKAIIPLLLIGAGLLLVVSYAAPRVAPVIREVRRGI